MVSFEFWDLGGIDTLGPTCLLLLLLHDGLKQLGVVLLHFSHGCREVLVEAWGILVFERVD